MSRSISVGFPTGKVKLTLWAGTEDEEAFEVKGLKCGTPYVLAYGTKHYLTDQEVRIARQLSGLFN